MKKSLLLEGFLFCLFLYLFIFQIIAIWPFTVDDMYITLRYAKHWTMGQGLVWNIHEPAVEGYSNFSFLLLACAAMLLKVDPVFCLKAAGCIGLMVTCLFIFLITRLWFARRESWLACIGVLLYQGQILWAVAGLETSLYEALIAASVYFSFKGLGYRPYPYSRTKFQNHAFFIAGLALSLAGLTRPEAPAFMALFVGLIAWETKQWKPIASFCLPIALVYAPYFFWRWHYFGFLFPNPVYCKGIATNDYGELDLSYLRLIWPFILFSLPACIGAQDRRHYFLWLPSLLYLILLSTADPIVAYHNRLFLPAFVLLYPLLLKGIAMALSRYLKDQDWHYYVCFYFVIACFAFLFIPSMTLSQYRYYTLNPKIGDQLRQEVLNWLGTQSQVGDFVVLGDSGMIPYYSDLNYIDSYCLNNKAMAQLPKQRRYELFCQQILRQKPRIIILISLTAQGKTTYAPSDYCLKTGLMKLKYYQRTAVSSEIDPNSTYRYELFIRP